MVKSTCSPNIPSSVSNRSWNEILPSELVILILRRYRTTTKSFTLTISPRVITEVVRLFLLHSRFPQNLLTFDEMLAGATMFQQGRRLGELSGRGGNFKELATRQCQSYLAAANALSLIDPKHAWVAVPADEHAVERVSEPTVVSSDRWLTSPLVPKGSKRRKITYHIPEEEFDNSTRAAEIVELSDIRREYTLALSRLQLSVDFPELERTSTSPCYPPWLLPR